MSAANDGADADSKIAAVARRLIFITVLAVPPVTVISFPASAPKSTPPVFGLTPASANPVFPTRCLPGKSGPGCAKNLGDRHRGHGFPICSTLSLKPIPGPLLDQQIDERQPFRLVDSLRQQFSIAVIVKSGILITHRTPPATLPRTVFLKPRTRAIESSGPADGFIGRKVKISQSGKQISAAGTPGR
jgi:hypothetical protein